MIKITDERGRTTTEKWNMAIKSVLTVAALSCIFAASAAEAATKTLRFDSGDFLAALGGSTANGFLELPNGGGIGGIAFYMPKDHRKDKPAIVRFLMQSNETGCNLDILAFGSARVRVGKVQGGGLGPTGGFDPVTAGVTTVPGTSGEVFTKDFKLRKLTSGPVQGLRKGDLVTVVIGRAAAATDTCANTMTVLGAHLIYPTP